VIVSETRKQLQKYSFLRVELTTI